ncbi:MAG TPA: glycosyl hydrolase [Bacilli bacterium]
MKFHVGKKVKIMFLTGAAASLIMVLGACSGDGNLNKAVDKPENNQEHEHGNKAGNGQGNQDSGDPDEITLMHIHGLGYSVHGERILVPSHMGLTVYANGKWMAPTGELHDFMGFATVDDRFYSSGHPPEGSTLENPLGLVVSDDEGKTLTFLDLYGEADFHGLTAGYKTHAIYVISPAVNSRMESKGLFYTLNEAKTWAKSEMNGITIAPSALAAHPTNEAVVAVGNQLGAFLSHDYGNHFAAFVEDMQTTALFYQYNGELLVGGVRNGDAVLFRYHVESRQKDEIKIPVLEQDAIQYISQNPMKTDELVFATFAKDVYLSEDKGQSWEKIADQGICLDGGKQ